MRGALFIRLNYYGRTSGLVSGTAGSSVVLGGGILSWEEFQPNARQSPENTPWQQRPSLLQRKPSQVPPSIQSAVETASPSPIPQVPAPSVPKKSGFSRLMGVGVAILLVFLCLGVIGGFAIGLIPNPFATEAVTRSTEEADTGPQSSLPSPTHESAISTQEAVEEPTMTPDAPLAEITDDNGTAMILVPAGVFPMGGCDQGLIDRIPFPARKKPPPTPPEAASTPPADHLVLNQPPNDFNNSTASNLGHFFFRAARTARSSCRRARPRINRIHSIGAECVARLFLYCMSPARKSYMSNPFDALCNIPR